MVVPYYITFSDTDAMINGEPLSTLIHTIWTDVKEHSCISSSEFGLPQLKNQVAEFCEAWLQHKGRLPLLYILVPYSLSPKNSPKLYFLNLVHVYFLVLGGCSLGKPEYTSQK